MKCSRCQATIRGNEKKCPNCGFKIDYSAQLAEREEQRELYKGKTNKSYKPKSTGEEKKLCPRCNKLLSTSDRFCNSCGYDITSNKLQRTSEAINKYERIIQLLAVVSLVLCFMKIVTLSSQITFNGKGVADDESYSIYNFAITAIVPNEEFNEVGKSLVWYSAIVFIAPIAISILKNAIKDIKSKFIALTIVSGAQIYLLSQFKSVFDSAFSQNLLGALVSVTWSPIYSLLFLVGIAIAAMSVLSLIQYIVASN